jgi:hypothetical protein
MNERAKEIEKSIIDDTINNDGMTGIQAFINFLSQAEHNNDEKEEIFSLVRRALQSPFQDRYKPINALVCRSVEWQAERLAKLEHE